MLRKVKHLQKRLKQIVELEVVVCGATVPVAFVACYPMATLILYYLSPVRKNPRGTQKRGVNFGEPAVHQKEIIAYFVNSSPSGRG